MKMSLLLLLDYENYGKDDIEEDHKDYAPQVSKADWQCLTWSGTQDV